MASVQKKRPKAYTARKLKFQTPEIMRKKIDDYFLSISYKAPKKNKDGEEIVNGLGEVYMETVFLEEPTVTGLALYLDTNRMTLCNYEGDERFCDVVKYAKSTIEKHYELRNIKRGKAGDIFALKNFGWKDENYLRTKTTVSQAPTIVINDASTPIDLEDV